MLKKNERIEGAGIAGWKLPAISKDSSAGEICLVGIDHNLGQCRGQEGLREEEMRMGLKRELGKMRNLGSNRA